MEAIIYLPLWHHRYGCIAQNTLARLRLYVFYSTFLIYDLVYFCSRANAAREIIATIWKTPRGFLCPGRKLPLTVLTEECIFIPTASNSRNNLFNNICCEPNSRVCISQNHFSHYVLTGISETDINDHSKFVSNWCILKNLIIYQTLGVGWYMKFILMRLVFQINEKEDKQR